MNAQTARRAAAPLLFAISTAVACALIWSHEKPPAPSENQRAAPPSARQAPGLRRIEGRPPPTNAPSQSGFRQHLAATGVDVESLTPSQYELLFAGEVTADSATDLEWNARLEDKPASVAAFFRAKTATQDQWAQAYRDDMCACPDRSCALALQDDFVAHAPEIVDSPVTEKGERSLAQALECARRLEAQVARAPTPM